MAPSRPRPSRPASPTRPSRSAATPATTDPASPSRARLTGSRSVNSKGLFDIFLNSLTCASRDEGGFQVFWLFCPSLLLKASKITTEMSCTSVF